MGIVKGKVGLLIPTERREKMSKITKEEKYLAKTCGLIRDLRRIEKNTRTDEFSEMEYALLNELVVLKIAGEKVISTQLAKRLNVTRSAVSQIVNNLEKQGVIKRVAVKNDKKSSYVELTETGLTNGFAESKKRILNGVKQFGVEKFETLCALAREFCLSLEK